MGLQVVAPLRWIPGNLWSKKDPALQKWVKRLWVFAPINLVPSEYKNDAYARSSRAYGKLQPFSQGYQNMASIESLWPLYPVVIGFPLLYGLLDIYSLHCFAGGLCGK